MEIETALTVLIAAAERAPFSANGYGAASQTAQRVIDGHMVVATVRGEQVRMYLDGSSKPLDRDDAWSILTGNKSEADAPATYFHGA